MEGSHVDEGEDEYPKENSSPMSLKLEGSFGITYEEEEIVQEIEEHLSFEISLCLYPEEKVLHHCLVDPNMELNVTTYVVYNKMGLVSTMIKGESPPFKGVFKNVCIQPLGVE